MHTLASRPEDAERVCHLEDERTKRAFRSKFARDRDRIVFSKCFRRLAKKTQVYLAGPGSEHLRTRLTHSLEVAQISKDMASALDVHPDLTEAIALGHDVGHSPFGHAGEQQLNAVLAGKELLPERIAVRTSGAQASPRHGEFKHNLQSVRLLTFLEQYHPSYDGLNLTIPCIEGILKHTRTTWPDTIGPFCEYPDTRDSLWQRLYGEGAWPRSVEGQLVVLADSIAQVAHDLADAVELDLLPLDDLLRRTEVQNAVNAARRVGKPLVRPPNAAGASYRKHVLVSQLVSMIIDYFVRNSVAGLKAAMARVARSHHRPTGWLLEDGPEPRADFTRLQTFRDNLVVNSFEVNRMDNKGQYLIRQLVDAYVSDPRQLPDTVLGRYLDVKARELDSLHAEGFRKWLRQAETTFKIRDCLANEEKRSLITFVGTRPDGPSFRSLDPAALDRIRIYMAFDADFVRAVVDYIAGMTDEFAERETGRLYH